MNASFLCALWCTQLVVRTTPNKMGHCIHYKPFCFNTTRHLYNVVICQTSPSVEMCQWKIHWIKKTSSNNCHGPIVFIRGAPEWWGLAHIRFGNTYYGFCLWILLKVKNTTIFIYYLYYNFTPIFCQIMALIRFEMVLYDTIS